jgi:hypothetical protein
VLSAVASYSRLLADHVEQRFSQTLIVVRTRGVGLTSNGGVLKIIIRHYLISSDVS